MPNRLPPVELVESDAVIVESDAVIVESDAVIVESDAVIVESDAVIVVSGSDQLQKKTSIMLYLVGLGLADEKDISVKGLEIVKSADRVYLEAYTSILLVNEKKLEEFYGRPIILADRDMVEQKSDEILENADKLNVAFLVVGDPFGATTHTDLALRARSQSIAVRTVHAPSILTAIGGATGLSLYNFGQTVSMVFFTESWRPDSFYDRIKENTSIGLHTLVLVDIKVKEPDLAAMVAGGGSGRRIRYEAPRFMSVAQCARQMLEVEAARKEGVYGEDSLAVGAARVGSEEQQVACGTLSELAEIDLGPPLHMGGE
ncbi:hypothetical protein DV737_g5380, partial [Chaetothyriales sp. CBS 132003]